MRKHFGQQLLKKALNRPLLMNGMIANPIYKPSSVFFNYLNKASKNETIEKIDDKDDKAAPHIFIPQKYRAIGRQTGGQTYIVSRGSLIQKNFQNKNAFNALHVSLSQSNFVCEICKRGYPFAKKYAKNQCQTCYKKMKKKVIAEETAETYQNGKENPLDQRNPATPQVAHNWSGKCPTCQRYENENRENVRHYARGCCTMCYRKEMKKLKRLTTDGVCDDVSSSRDDASLNN